MGRNTDSRADTGRSAATRRRVGPPNDPKARAHLLGVKDARKAALGI